MNANTLNEPVASPCESKRPSPVFRLEKILAPVDFSEGSMKALQYVIAMARQFGATVTLLHILEPVYLSGMGLLPGEFTELQRPVVDPAKEQLERLKDTLHAFGVEAEPVLMYGYAGKSIVSEVKARDIDLIILATHGRTGLAHAFMGSAAEEVVRHAGCPVLVVREREQDFVVNPPAPAKE